MKTAMADRNANAPLTETEPDTLAGKAYLNIRDEILKGALPVGAILSRRKLAEKFNMSFLPITEALQRLETEGLVESRPRIGTRVRVPVRQDILDRFVIREALETQAARLCCANMIPKEREALSRSADHLDNLFKAIADDDDPRFLFSVHTYHMQFHMRIAEMAKSPGLVKAIEKERVLIFNWLYDTTSHRKSLPDGFHTGLAKALCSGDAAQADKVMRSHIQYGLEDVLVSFEALTLTNGWRTKRGS
jgi:DNA-binding GntR family transcriptional regulator